MTSWRGVVSPAEGKVGATFSLSKCTLRSWMPSDSLVFFLLLPPPFFLTHLSSSSFFVGLCQFFLFLLSSFMFIPNFPSYFCLLLIYPGFLLSPCFFTIAIHFLIFSYQFFSSDSHFAITFMSPSFIFFFQILFHPRFFCTLLCSHVLISHQFQVSLFGIYTLQASLLLPLFLVKHQHNLIRTKPMIILVVQKPVPRSEDVTK